MTKYFTISILLFFCSCGIHSVYENPNGQLGTTRLEFKRNGKCTITSHSNGSDSGSITYQEIGKYRISNDTINVHYYLKRSKLDRNEGTIEDVDWKDADEFNQTYLFTVNKDTISLISDSRILYLSAPIYVLSKSEKGTTNIN